MGCRLTIIFSMKIVAVSVEHSTITLFGVRSRDNSVFRIISTHKRKSRCFSHETMKIRVQIREFVLSDVQFVEWG